MRNLLARMVANIARKTAFAACGAASNWNMYQPEEPAMLKTMVK